MRKLVALVQIFLSQKWGLSVLLTMVFGRPPVFFYFKWTPHFECLPKSQRPNFWVINLNFSKRPLFNFDIAITVWQVSTTSNMLHDGIGTWIKPTFRCERWTKPVVQLYFFVILFKKQSLKSCFWDTNFWHYLT